MEKSYNPNDITRYSIACLTSDDASMLQFNKRLKGILTLNDRQNEFLRLTIPPIMFLDSFKLLLYKLHNGLAIPSEVQMFSLYNGITNTSEIENLYYNRDDYALYSLSAVNFFSELPYLGKISMFKEICDLDNKFLASITKLHDNDLDEYDVKIDENFVYDYYIDRYKYLLKNDAIVQPSAIGTEIAGIIRKSAMKDPTAMYELVSSMNRTIFDNIDALLEGLDPEAKDYLEKSLLEYTLDEEKYNCDSVNDESLLIEIIGLYTKVRKIKMDEKTPKELKLTNEDKGISNEERNN